MNAALALAAALGSGCTDIEETSVVLSTGVAMAAGLIEVWLEGEKLKGGYALKRIRGGRQPQWLVIKMKDEHADARRRPVNTRTGSVKTGRVFEQIGRDAAEHHE